MSQFARPTIDVTRTNWVDQVAGTVGLYGQIDETIANDAEYVETVLNPAAAIYVTKLSSIIDPVSASGHELRYRYRKNAAADDAINLIVQLRQGYVDEGTPGTLIASATHNNIPGDAWTAGTLTLSSGEANSITNYADLFVRLSASTAV